jgi:hypothetical protein
MPTRVNVEVLDPLAPGARAKRDDAALDAVGQDDAGVFGSEAVKESPADALRGRNPGVQKS